MFVGRVGDIQDLNSHNMVALEVKHVYKKGNKEIAAGSKVHVYTSKHCAYPNIKMKGKYLFMLKDGIKYLLDDDSFVLEWPGGKARAQLKTTLKNIKQGDICDHAF